jgi:polysaccharide biosynthesis protein PslJ
MTNAVQVRTPERAPTLSPGWPLFLLFLGFPLWWVLGVAGFIYPILAVPMLFWLLRKRSILLPPGFLIWLAFLAWTLASATQLTGTGRTIGYLWRFGTYASATVFLLYVFNMSEERLSATRLVKLLAAFWAIVVLGGYLGVLAPSLSFASPVERMLPPLLAGDAFIQVLVHPASAQIHDFLGYSVARPAAPFPYTNDWGSTYGLLVPFVILGWGRWGSTRARLLMGGLAVASVVPVVLSLNRGLWISLAVGLVYAAFRLAAAGRERALVALIGLVLVAGSLVFFTPLKGVIDARLETGHSNERRTMLYQEAGLVTLESPLFGFGAPTPSEWNPNAPPVGTQGLLWTVLVSHGFVGAGLFLAWFVQAFWRTRKAWREVPFWCHVMLLIALIQLAVYDMLPTQLHIIMLGIGLAMRELARHPEDGSLPSEPERVGATP